MEAGGENCPNMRDIIYEWPLRHCTILKNSVVEKDTKSVSIKNFLHSPGIYCFRVLIDIKSAPQKGHSKMKERQFFTPTIMEVATSQMIFYLLEKLSIKATSRKQSYTHKKFSL
jgi:hypothetical protein